MGFPAWLGADLSEVERCFARRIPATLSIALEGIATRLRRESVLANAAPPLETASRLAYARDFSGARECYDAALSMIGAGSLVSHSAVEG